MDRLEPCAERGCSLGSEHDPWAVHSLSWSTDRYADAARTTMTALYSRPRMLCSAAMCELPQPPDNFEPDSLTLHARTMVTRALAVLTELRPV